METLIIIGFKSTLIEMIWKQHGENFLRVDFREGDKFCSHGILKLSLGLEWIYIDTVDVIIIVPLVGCRSRLVSTYSTDFFIDRFYMPV